MNFNYWILRNSNHYRLSNKGEKKTMYAEMPVLFKYAKQKNNPTWHSAVKNCTEVEVFYKEWFDKPH